MRAIRAVLTMAATALLAGGAPTPEQAQELVNRIHKKVKENFERLPNYICRQTVERSQHRPKKKPQAMDTLRLDVALINGRELYSWPGASRFGDASLAELVKSGAIGSGAYATQPESLFLRRGPRFTYVGDEMMDGRKTCRINYTVALADSVFRISDGKLAAVVGYHGTVWADAETFELVRLDSITDNIPSQLQLTRSQDSVHYQSVLVGNQRCVLPRTVELQMATRNVEFHNLTKFEGCRQYVGESSIHFDDAEVTAPVEMKQLEIPAGVRVEMLLDAPIRSDGKFAVGDEVTATLSVPMRKNDTVLIPAGAKCTGRLTRLSAQKARSMEYNLVGIAFHLIETKQVRASFRAQLIDAGITASGAYFLPFFSAPGARLPFGWGGAVIPVDHPDPNEGIFCVRGAKLAIPKGTRLVWQTQ